MESFEEIVKVLFEEDNYWVRQSEKINLTKEEKKKTGKPSIPRPEIDLVALNQSENHILVLEVKSFFDSPGVRLSELDIEYNKATGKYKLFTNKNYWTIVLSRLKKDFIKQGMADKKTRFTLGLVAGNVYQNKTEEIRKLFNEKGWFFLGPDEIKDRVLALAKKGYQNSPIFMTAKILMR
ncbi:MAG: hypothetical protein HOA32_08910 [Nitrospina sp.]|jgi:hypothetical protein|nr:hypothetical protein [Nitrospina sp.]MBT6738816.1 hypothetical protein [Nitrospina sp.]MBT6901115.1 hypothetical protein [Nitrospina sp.]